MRKIFRKAIHRSENHWLEQIDAIARIKFNPMKIEKLDKIAKKNTNLRLFLKNLRVFKKRRRVTCLELVEDVKQHNVLRTNFKWIRVVNKSRLINKKIKLLNYEYKAITTKLNLIHKSEDYIRLILSHLKNLFAEIQAEILKTNDTIGRKEQQKINNDLRKTLELFKTANFQLDNGNFENLKNLYVEICTKLKFWCRTMPYIISGVVAIDYWFPDEYVKLMVQIRLKKLRKLFFASHIQKLSLYYDEVARAISCHNFFEIAKGVDDFLTTADGIMAWFDWDKFAVSEFQRIAPRVISAWEKIEKYYLELHDKLTNHNNPEWIQSIFKEYQSQICGSYVARVKEYKRLFRHYVKKTDKSISSSTVSENYSFNIPQLQQTRSFVKIIDQFVVSMDKINNNANICHYYRFFIPKAIDHAQQYIIYIVNNLVKLHISDSGNEIAKVRKYSAVLSQISTPQPGVTLEQVQNTYLYVRKIGGKVLKIYQEQKKIKTRVKELGAQLLLINYQAEKFYSSPEFTEQAHQAIELYKIHEYERAANLVLQMKQS